MKNFKFEKKDILFLAVVICLAAGFSVFLMRYRFAVSFDEVNYLKLAASGAMKGFSNVLHPYWSPFFPLCVALFSKVIHNFELAGRLFSILCGVLIIIPIFLFTKFYFNRRIARYAVLLLAFFPSLAFINNAAMSESLYTLLITLGIISGWLALTNRSWVFGILVGVLFGLSYLTRPEGIGALVVFVCVSSLVVIFLVFRKKRYRTLLIPFAAIMGFVSVAIPYIIYLHKTTGEWTISTRLKSLQQGEAILLTDKQEQGEIYRILSEDNKEVLIDQMFHTGDFLQAEHRRGKPVIKVTPAILLKKYAKNFTVILNDTISQVLSGVFFILGIIGFFSEPWSKKRTLRELYLLSYIVFYWFLLIPLFHITARYLLPQLPICFIWIGKGSEQLLLWIRKTLKQSLALSQDQFYGRLANGIFLFIIFVGVFLPELGRVVIRSQWSDDYYADPVELKKAGLWLKEHAQETPIIMTRNHTVDFYAENYNIAESVTIPQNDLNRVLSYARYRGVDYIVLNERYKKDFPLIAHLLEEKDIPNDLKLVYRYQDKSGLKTVIYQLIKD